MSTRDDSDDDDDGGAGDPGPPREPDPVVIPIEEELDLHTFAPRDVPSVVAEYIREARAHGFTEVRIIHGRGVGLQRRIVRKRLAQLDGVIAFGDAPAHVGGWGATVVHLRGKPKPEPS